MDDETIKDITAELSKGLLGRPFGKVFQLTRASLAIDFRTQDSSYLFISAEPAQPRLYMIKRRVRDLEKQSLPLTPFAQVLRKHLGNATLLAITKDPGDRIVRLSFNARDEMGNTLGRTLVAQLTGRTANLLLLDDRGFILDMLRNPRGMGQQIGDPYAHPPAQAAQASAHAPLIARGSFASLSEAADQHYLSQEAERLFAGRAAHARQRLRKEIDQRQRLQRRLEGDLIGHGDADEHKRIGDLLLANLGTAERHGETVTLTDYYAPDTPRIELRVDERKSLQEEAVQRFARYTRARRATQEIARRMETLMNELEMLRAQQSEIERIIAERDEDELASFFEEGKSGASRPKRSGPPRGAKPAEGVQGARRYRSSDGYEILVGRAARDNDHLTFRIARPHDLWLHAADYPGSHVVVRNPTRAEIPQRTIIEAAQLAANYSHAKRDAKVDVHYTPRKFLSKPKGAAPGLVRMSSFRSITVEPGESAERI
ncbi:MAG TPA: NFACT family protein [Pyrinomonadaceae bacterium]|jgi:predicted ribosome quality control (RQC) complex YloA/Tae2 family protein|nr:NFACT family protein [Pyrinomonadaceae bacterium]